MTSAFRVAILGLCLFLAIPVVPNAADQWTELKSAHFTVISNAGDRSTRTLAWQLEQVRSVMVMLWAWARVDLNKPLTVIALKDENSMRALAPKYWEGRQVRPASVWASGADQHTAIAEARKLDPKAPGSYEAEALLLDREDKPDAAKLALATAVENGSTNGYVHYRLAGLTWRRDADQDTLKAIDGYLLKATALNPRDADAYSWLGEIRAVLGAGEPAGLVLRAISLEPHESVHRLRAAYVLARQRKFDEAAVHARAGAELATTDAERRRAQELLDLIAKAKAAGGD